jgi:hypothetical protein
VKEETHAKYRATNQSSASADSLESGGAAAVAESSGGADKWDESERLGGLNLPRALTFGSVFRPLQVGVELRFRGGNVNLFSGWPRLRLLICTLSRTEPVRLFYSFRHFTSSVRDTLTTKKVSCNLTCSSYA